MSPENYTFVKALILVIAKNAAEQQLKPMSGLLCTIFLIL